MSTSTREIHLVRRPVGRPTTDDFRTVEVELPDPAPGQVLVRNTVLSVDPYMRGRMNDTESYVAPYALDAPLEGGAVGEVLSSGVDHLSPGDVVTHMAGWREHALVDAAEARKVDTSLAPASAYLSVLGMPGLTAYVGLTRIGGLQEGEVVHVSGAAGAVGSLVGQMARLLGASRVVGSAGSPEKVRWLTEELGFDAAFDYRDGSLVRQLGTALDGRRIDVYFDNVGGDQLEAAIEHMADFGRVAACGAIATYDATEMPPGPRNLVRLVQRRLRLQGFIVSDHREAAGEFYRTVGGWLADGSLVARETTFDGLDRCVEAFLALGTGGNTGKMLVRL
ncbi:MAG: NADP-dependent oxidoreductase [Nocardioides sp.]